MLSEAPHENPIIETLSGLCWFTIEYYDLAKQESKTEKHMSMIWFLPPHVQIHTIFNYFVI